MKRTTTLYDKNGNEMKIPIRKALPITALSARYTGFNPETLLLKKGSIRLKGYMPLPCDIILERDVPITLRDGVTIYTDIFRPADAEKHPAILALSPYGKEIGSQWLDDTPNHAGIPIEATSGLQKFEGPDPAYWCNHGYAVINPDVRGAYHSEGVILFFGSDYGRDGADICEWCAEQLWCNGKIGMSGNSWLAISQWFVAAQKPKHLAAIAPWEGLNDCYREIATRGGVMMPEFIKMLSDSFASTENGGIEDCITVMNEQPTWNTYWEDKAADLEAITVPAYIVASYTNPIHAYGSIEGYRRISSENKWLRIHNTGEWDDYYNAEHTEDLRKFFDRYLMDKDNGWEETPKVRLSVLNPGGKDIIDRVESDFPIPRTQYRKLYLNAESGSMSEEPVTRESNITYNSDKKGKAVFQMRMGEDTEITGYIKLRLWVSALDHDDMDLLVKMEKRRPNGFKYKYILGPGMDMAAKGYIRVSMRELDEERSTAENPRQSMLREQKLKHGEIVPVDILVWPMGLLFKKEDMLRVTVSAHKTMKMWTGPFKLKMAKIALPKQGYTYMSDDNPEMYTIGGAEMFAGSDGNGTQLPKDHNKGRHAIYCGGKYDSFLYVPIVPQKED
ncbi:MAG: CocE/NonD family hydrolase [Clostridia bacterium]|nr:CocE/NonD family hydrolase [Clostridia bacterium]